MLGIYADIMRVEKLGWNLRGARATLVNLCGKPTSWASSYLTGLLWHSEGSSLIRNWLPMTVAYACAVSTTWGTHYGSHKNNSNEGFVGTNFTKWAIGRWFESLLLHRSSPMKSLPSLSPCVRAYEWKLLLWVKHRIIGLGYHIWLNKRGSGYL